MLIAVLFIGLASGCAERLTERTLIPPGGDDAGACLDRCNLQQDECRDRQLAREEGCERQRTMMVADHEACLAAGGMNCQAPETCLGAEFSVCELGYEMCFTECGGRVETGWRSRPWEAPASAPTEAAPPTETTAPIVPDQAASQGGDDPHYVRG
jgi:hypothetical protein